MENKNACLMKMKNILNIPVQNKKIIEHICDAVMFQFHSFLDEANCITELKHFNAEENRIDSILFKFCKDKDSYKDLWKVLQKLLLLSHGQASFERGFSVNRQVEVENLKQETIIAQRLIIDYIKSVGGILKVDINKGLLLSAAGARQKYMHYSAEQKNKNETEMTPKKEEIFYMKKFNNYKKQKRMLEADVHELLKSADDFSEKAVQSRNISV